MATSILLKFLTLKWNISRTIGRIEVGDGSFFCIFHALSFELNFFFDRRFPLRFNVWRSFVTMPTNLPFYFFIQFLEQLLKFLANFTLLKYVKSQRSYGFLITKKLIFGFQILDLKVHFSVSLTIVNLNKATHILGLKLNFRHLSDANFNMKENNWGILCIKLSNQSQLVCNLVNQVWVILIYLVQ